MLTRETQQLIRQVEQGAVVLRGARQLLLLQNALRELMTRSGFTMTFDPTSAPDLVDTRTIPLRRGVQRGLAGAVLGLVVGALMGRPGIGAAVGAGIGGSIGVVEGLGDVKRGWRIRAVRDANGVPLFEIGVGDPSPPSA